jgi:hypothetical protein
MKNYLRTIHQRSPAHKKRFALLVSGSITLVIFGFWSLVNFSGQAVVVANRDADNSGVPSNTVSPFEDLSGGVANTIDAIKNQFGQVKQAVGSVDVQNKYNEARNQALSN